MTDVSDVRSEAQTFTYWFTAWPSSHVNAGKTVEVMPRAVHEAEVERLREGGNELVRAYHHGTVDDMIRAVAAWRRLVSEDRP